MRNNKNRELNKGTFNVVEPDLIPKGAAQSSHNWRTFEDHIATALGRTLIGDRETGDAGVLGFHTGYDADGNYVQYRKIGTNIQYRKEGETTWTTVIDNLNELAEYSFCDYTSLAGNFTFACGADGIFKIHNANPQSFSSMYNPSINYRGFAIIDKARMFLWNRENDPTGLYLSHIDEANYTVVNNETLGTGDGSTTLFSGTLATFQETRTFFAFEISAKVASAVNVSAVTQARQAQITSTAHGLAVNDKVLFASLGGMTQLNGLVGTVKSVVDANNYTIDIDTRTFTAYTSGGNGQQVEVFTDDNNGILLSNNGGTGTINYTTGAYSVTFVNPPLNTIAVEGDYQWEDTNDGGVTDFRYTTPARLAGEGDVFRQDEGGDKILNVEIFEGLYYSIKERTVYELSLTADDTDATNQIFRKNIGMPNWRASASTSQGIIFLNTANPSNPELTIIRRNITGDSLEASNLIPHYDLSQFEWDKCAMSVYGKRVLFTGKTIGATRNNRVFDYVPTQNSVDELRFDVNMFSEADGLLFSGDSITDNVFQMFSSYSDDSFELDREWVGNEEGYGVDNLKKFKRVRFRGTISKGLKFKVYVITDNGNRKLVGTILGTGNHIDSAAEGLIGSAEVGSQEVGGGGTGTVDSPFYIEMKVSVGKFSKRTFVIVPEGFGFGTIREIDDRDIRLYASRMPSKYRKKDNVSLDGAEQDLDDPE